MQRRQLVESAVGAGLSSLLITLFGEADGLEEIFLCRKTVIDRIISAARSEQIHQFERSEFAFVQGLL